MLFPGNTCPCVGFAPGQLGRGTTGHMGRRGGQAQSTSSLSGHVCSVGMVSRNCEFNWSTTCLGFYLPVLPHLCLPEELVLRWCFLVISPGIGHLFEEPQFLSGELPLGAQRGHSGGFGAELGRATDGWMHSCGRKLLSSVSPSPEAMFSCCGLSS